VESTTNYSASDLTALCREAALGPVRELGAAIANISVDRIRPVKISDFADALQVNLRHGTCRSCAIVRHAI